MITLSPLPLWWRVGVLVAYLAVTGLFVMFWALAA